MQTRACLSLAAMLIVSLLVADVPDVGGVAIRGQQPAARRCYFTRQLRATGQLTAELDTCDSRYCFRGALTSAGAAGVAQLYSWPVKAGDVMRGCVDSRQPESAEILDWYAAESVVLCESSDACNW